MDIKTKTMNMLLDNLGMALFSNGATNGATAAIRPW
jgi:hypothetical protein